MTTLVKIQRKGQLTLPSRLRAAIGVSEGDRLTASVQGGRIVLTPAVEVDRSKFPNAGDEYTPAQRRVIDARLAEAEDDIKHGRVHGPFSTHEAMMTFLNSGVRKRRAAKASRKNK
jgi:AbrB family looped-hinge helix DNA binding protein